MSPESFETFVWFSVFLPAMQGWISLQIVNAGVSKASQKHYNCVLTTAQKLFSD